MYASEHPMSLRTLYVSEYTIYVSEYPVHVSEHPICPNILFQKSLKSLGTLLVTFTYSI